MERLSDKAIDIINELHTDRLDYTSEYLPLIDASDRLAAYEDTGLVPEEINTLQSYKLLDKHERGKLFEYQNLGCTIDRLRELAKADKDGRLVVLDEPIRPLVWGDKERDTVLCPRCLCDLMGGFEFAPSSETMMFQCPHCGQPIASDKAITMEEAEAACAERRHP